MEDIPSQVSPDQKAIVAIEIIPVEEEENDFDTLAVIERVYADLERDAARLAGYTVTSLPTSAVTERGLDIIALIALVSASIVASKELLVSLFNIVAAALELLAKREHVQEIEIIVDGKPLILRDLNKKTAKELIEAFEAQHPGTLATLTSRAPVEIKAKVSKEKRMRK